MFLKRIIVAAFTALFAAGSFAGASARNIDDARPLLSKRRSVLYEKTYGETYSPGGYGYPEPGKVSIVGGGFSSDKKSYIVETGAEYVHHVEGSCSPNANIVLTHAFGMVINDLKDGTKYTCEVHGVAYPPGSAPVNGPSTEFVFQTEPNAPGQTTVTPKGFSSEFATYRVSMSSDGATGYEAWCSPAVNVEYGGPTMEEATFSNLKPSTDYSCQARAFRGVVQPIYGPSAHFSFSVPKETPGAVTVLSQTIRNTEATFRLSAEIAASFEMSCTSPGIPIFWASFSKVSGLPNTADAKLTNLKPGVSYSCKAYAVGRAGSNGPTKNISFKTTPSDKSLPSQVVVRSVEEQQNAGIIKTTLSYRAKTHGARCYDTSKPHAPVKTSVSTGSLVTVIAYNLRTDSNFVCEIFGTNEWGSGTPLRISFRTKTSAPSPVRVTGITTTTNTAEIVTTKTPLSVSFETSCWSDSPSKNIPAVVVRRVSTSNAMHFRLSNLVSKTNYACKIVPIGKGGVKGGYTMTGSFTTK